MSKDRLLTNDEIIYKLEQIQIQAAAEHRSFEWAQGKLLELINTQKRIYAESENKHDMEVIARATTIEAANSYAEKRLAEQRASL